MAEEPDAGAASGFTGAVKPHLLGVDPGHTHVGVSEWRGQTCVFAGEVTPAQFVEMFTPEILRSFDAVLAEQYVPQGGYGNAETGVQTAKLLGWLEWSVRIYCALPVVLVTRADRHAALTRLKAVGYRFLGTGDHARDAQAVVVAGMRWPAAKVSSART